MNKHALLPANYRQLKYVLTSLFQALGCNQQLKQELFPTAAYGYLKQTLFSGKNGGLKQLSC